MKRIFFAFHIILAMLLTACSDNDSFTTSRSNLLTFTKDTIKLDTVFTNVASSTYTFWVFNHSGDGIRLNSVRLMNGNQTGFRVNVDGSYLDNTLGSVVNDLEVRSGDSIRVFVELTAPENKKEEPQLVSDDLIFSLESGVQQRVRLQCYAWDALKMTDLHITADTMITTTKPLVFYGKGIEVDSGAVLSIKGATLYFHDQAGISVRGTLKTDSVVMRGDRLDHMFDYLPYHRVSGQWRGIHFERSSVDNTMTDTEILNAMTAVRIDSAAIDTLTQRLTMNRCIVHNAKGFGVAAYSSNIGLYYCQITNTLFDCLAVFGGKAEVDHCTIAQFYPFQADRGAALTFASLYDDLRLSCTNSIFTGYDADEVMALRNDTTLLFRYRFDNCLMRTPAVENDTVSFKNIQWETPKDSIQGKQHFVNIDEDNLIYDFHLDSLSTAKGKGCYISSTDDANTQ